MDKSDNSSGNNPIKNVSCRLFLLLSALVDTCMPLSLVDVSRSSSSHIDMLFVSGIFCSFSSCSILLLFVRSNLKFTSSLVVFFDFTLFPAPGLTLLEFSSKIVWVVAQSSGELLIRALPIHSF